MLWSLGCCHTLLNIWTVRNEVVHVFAVPIKLAYQGMTGEFGVRENFLGV